MNRYLINIVQAITILNVHIYSAYYVPDVDLIILHRLTYLVLTIILSSPCNR